jgi:hypothetical protein
MNSANDQNNHQASPKAAPSLWGSIALLIIVAFGLVALFGLLVYLLVNGAERMGLPAAAHTAVLVLVSGVFAWLLKRLTDVISSMSQVWFPEDSDPPD